MEEITRLWVRSASAGHMMDLEGQARECGWADLTWCSNAEYHTLYGRRAVLVKTEPTRPAWLFEGEQVIFTTRAGEYSPEVLQSRHDAVDKAVYAGWVALRWVDDRDSGFNHLVARKHPDVRYYSDGAGSAYVHIDFPRPPAPSVDATPSTYVVDFGKGVGDRDGLPRIRSELRRTRRTRRSQALRSWPAPISIKADLDEALLAEVNNERHAVVDFIRAIARDVSTDSRASDELFRVAKSIEAGFHRVMR